MEPRLYVMVEDESFVPVAWDWFINYPDAAAHFFRGMSESEEAGFSVLLPEKYFEALKARFEDSHRWTIDNEGVPF